jgi:hypothetical protein
MKIRSKMIIYAILIFCCLISTGLGLPPKIQRVNDFIKNHSYLSTKNFSFLCTMDQSFNANLIYFQPNEIGNRASLYFVSFNPAGNVRIVPKEVLAEGWNHSLDESESRIISDFNGNTHLLLRKMLDFERMEYTYIMIDSIGDIQKNVSIERGLYLSRFCVLPNGNIIAQGTIRGIGADKQQYNLIYVLEKGSSSFSSFQVEVADYGYPIPNIGADIYPLDNENILLLRLYSSSISKAKELHRTIINLPTKRIINTESIDAREHASIINTNMMLYLWYGGTHFITIGDTIAYQFMLFPNNGGDISDYSMGVIYLDSKGNFIDIDQKHILTMTTGNLLSSNQYDFLIRNNRNIFGGVITTPEYKLSLYGLISFRDFPQIIIDTGLE